MERRTFLKLAGVSVLAKITVAGCVTMPPAKRVYDPVDYGGVPDGQTLCTASIQKAIDECWANGGGVVRLSGGKFLSGTIFMKSNVTLEIAEGSILLGSTNLGDYPVTVGAYRSYTEKYTDKSLIYGENLENISITGKGTFDGQGMHFGGPYKVRPFGIRLIKCTKVTVEDLTLRNSAMWMQHYLACENLTLTGIKVYNHANQNNDMIDIDGCRNVIISDCYGDTDDDALTFKSTSEHACENVTVTNCILSSHCNAIKCGTESTGGFKNFTISNCVIKPSADEEPIFGKRSGISGISLEIVDGGVMDGITISNISMDGPEVPIFIRLGNRARKHFPEAETPPVGELSNVLISQVMARNTGKTGCAITGIPGYPVRNIKLSNMILEFAGGVKDPVDPADVPELEDLYPESTMFGELPAYGFFIRHAEDISLSDITTSTIDPDMRKPVLTQDVRGITLTNAPMP
ncbi:MAG: glycoside hydrolase [Bacteroidales bacterium]|nr:glycoside hydrolase [Bacteroidales bacterium]